MARIVCPECKISNRAKRKICKNCCAEITHLRRIAPIEHKQKAKNNPPQAPAQWPAVGTKVQIIRTKHGWWDCSISGTYLGEGKVKVAEGYYVTEPYEVEILRPRDMVW